MKNPALCECPLSDPVAILHQTLTGDAMQPDTPREYTDPTTTTPEPVETPDAYRARVQARNVRESETLRARLQEAEKDETP